MGRGDIINFQDGAEGVITNVGIGDFPGDPYPIYYTIVRNGQNHSIGETHFIMSSQLKKKQITTPAPKDKSE